MLDILIVANITYIVVGIATVAVVDTSVFEGIQRPFLTALFWPFCWARRIGREVSSFAHHPFDAVRGRFSLRRSTDKNAETDLEKIRTELLMIAKSEQELKRRRQELELMFEPDYRTPAIMLAETKK